MQLSSKGKQCWKVGDPGGQRRDPCEQCSRISYRVLPWFYKILDPPLREMNFCDVPQSKQWQSEGVLSAKE
ncbi:hypothetical protein E2C01_007762 [Portunus trituberculatus]|uniref:Uncharacterized protein n=1 Tax=Portunus trituberculatus TaxID=210409 RepID=A0A5B7CZ13_PORTR|nr:hypothetical protein [Portunus trituberculatus]